MKTSWTYSPVYCLKIFYKILEVGIGTGAVAKIISNRIGPLTGIDISEEMISNINHPDIKAILADVQAQSLFFVLPSSSS